MKHASDFAVLKLSAKLGVALWLLMSGGPAQADLIRTDDLVVDTSTGLEWLRLTRGTLNASALQVLARLGPGGDLAGFQYATFDQMRTLFMEVFGRPTSITNLEGGLDLNATINFANLFGPTNSVEGLPTVNGVFGLDLPDRSVIELVFFYGRDINGNLTGASDTEDRPLGFKDPTVGSFLVRAVPEPSLSLLSVSLIGLAAVVLRKRKSASD